MTYLISWYAQDFLWVLGRGRVIIPEVFLATLIFISLRHPSRGVEVLWASFLGGLFWDLRWVGFPGLSSLFYVTTILMSRWTWLSLPASGRTAPVFAMILWASFFPISAVRIYMGGSRGIGVLGAYFLQQSYLLPLVLFASLIFVWRMKNSDG